jgi:hypothetical protein
MAVTVKRVTLWRGEVTDRPGALAATLEPIAQAGVDLSVCMGYRIPGHSGRAVIELAPIAGKKATSAAQAAGLAPAAIPALLVTGDNRAGLGHAIGSALAGAGINLGFLVTQVIGRKFTSVAGFDSEADAARAAPLIKKAAASKPKRK